MSLTLRVPKVARIAGVIAVVASAAAVTLAVGTAQAATKPSTPVWSASTPVTPLLTVAAPSTAAAYAAGVLSATNAQRTAHGLKALSVTSCLTGYASPWATHLAATKTLVHQNLAPFLSVCKQYYAAENIADGNVTAAQVVAMWMASPDHKANLLGSHYTHIAIGAAKSGSTWYVVQDFSG
jgi:uncharacterized protein YkwD